MSCPCSNNDSVHGEEQANELLNRVGLLTPVERARGAVGGIGSALRSLAKSDRADSLGLSPEVGALYLRAAERDRDQARRQLRVALDALEERTTREDWEPMVAEVRREFEAHEGARLLKDAQERLRMNLLDAEGLSGRDAAEVMALAETAWARVRDEGLAGVADHLRAALQRADEAFASPEMGRQPASPLAEATRVCITIAVAAAAIALAVCGFVYMCWCCFFWPIVAACTAAVAVCLYEEAIGWR